MQNNRKVGTEQEERVANFLQKKGYEILARNFRCHFGEVDLIAKKGRRIHFVEVKYRANLHHGTGAEAVGYQKQKRISNVASYYFYQRRIPADTSCQFDVAAVTPDEITLIENAFLYNGSFNY